MKERCLGTPTILATLAARQVFGRILPASQEGTAALSLPRPLLLLHGLGCSSEAWSPTLRCLEQARLDQPVVAPDFPGCGRSPGPPKALEIEELADWTVDLLDALNFPRVDLVGNSMGCQVALRLARDHSERVGAMVLVGPTTGDHYYGVGRYLLGLLLDGFQEPLRYNLALLRMYWQMGPRRYFATAKAMVRDDPLDRPAAIRARCLIVRGVRDRIVPEAVARRLASILPRGSFAEVEGVAHAVQFSAPDRFTRLALAFLTGAHGESAAPDTAAPTDPSSETESAGSLPTESSYRARVVEESRLSVQWIAVDERRVRCRIVAPAPKTPAVSGIGLPLLAIHGLAGSADVWLATLQCLEQRRLKEPVIAPDMPGYGLSRGPAAALGIEELAEWTVQLLDGMGISRAHVAAHSMGCQVALALARRHPERVGALVLSGPTTGRRLMPPWRYLVGLANTFREPLSYKPTALKLFRQMGLRRYVATIRRMLEDDPLTGIAAITVPCLVVCGELDAIIPAAVAQALAEALPQGRFARVPRAGHVVPYHQPEAFTATLLEFLGSEPAETGEGQGHGALPRASA